MKLDRSNTVSKLERELETLRQTILETESEQARQAELAEQAAQEKRALAEDPTSREAAASRVVAHRDERDRLADVIALRRKSLASSERDLEHARYADSQAAFESAARRQHDTADKLSSHLAAAIEALPALLAARDEFDQAKARARELCPDGVDFELLANADEPAFPDGVDRLVELVQAGPRRPLATTKAASAKQQLERESAESSRMRSAVDQFFRQGHDFEKLERLSPERRASALALFERRLAAKRERGACSDVLMQRLEQRLERVRELVAEATTAGAV